MKATIYNNPFTWFNLFESCLFEPPLIKTIGENGKEAIEKKGRLNSIVENVRQRIRSIKERFSKS